jgi:sterol desaturase/sphingolipid hydroxylase (fatty acid hydroxylase superfamily)
MGAKFVSNRDETIPLFRNPILEYFSHIHPATPIVVYLPVVMWVGYLAVVTTGWLAFGGMFVVGVVFWTLTEYTIHRWAFHKEPQTELGKKLHFLVHGIHHDYPRDSTRLVMPLLVSVPLAVLFYFLFRYTLGDFHFAMFSGFVFGYVAYDSIHYATHHFPMTNRVARFVKEYHMKHHFVDEHTAYGVSNPLWDYVFNTVPEWARKRRHKPQPQATNR